MKQISIDFDEAFVQRDLVQRFFMIYFSQNRDMRIDCWRQTLASCPRDLIFISSIYFYYLVRGQLEFRNCTVLQSNKSRVSTLLRKLNN